VAVITIGGGLPVLPGVASSCVHYSASETSVSMLAVLSGAKKFLVGTVLAPASFRTLPYKHFARTTQKTASLFLGRRVYSVVT
jgi:hypothetical protein